MQSSSSKGTPQTGSAEFTDLSKFGNSLGAADVALHEVCHHICKCYFLADRTLPLHACAQGGPYQAIRFLRVFVY